MSRESLFKAKRKGNGEWVEGYLFDDGMVNSNTLFVGDIVIEKDKGNADYDWSITGRDFYEVEPRTVCQYTKLQDRDKTPMYENDIVRANARGNVHGVIRFGKYGDMKTDYGFYIEWDKTQPYWRNDICYWQNEIRVIGNIFDNPELLEVAE